MENAKRRIAAAFEQENAFLMLLASLVFALIVVPLSEGIGQHEMLRDAVVTLVMVVGLAASRRRGALFYLATVMAAVAVPMTWTSLFVDRALVFVASCLLASAFFAITAVLISAAVVRRIATLQSIFGAACIYLLMGLGWAMVYLAADRTEQESLSVPDRRLAAELESDALEPSFSQSIYFSFVTMSTLGYGDIVPETPLVRTLAWMQSVAGQFYVAVLVAWLVSALPRPDPEGNPRAGPRPGS